MDNNFPTEKLKFSDSRLYVEPAQKKHESQQ